MANIWDNIFSQSLSPSPLIFTQSLHVKFPLQYQGYTADGMIDYSQDLNVLTLSITKNLIFREIQILRLQFDLSSMIVVSEKNILSDCKRYRPVISEKPTQLKWNNINEKLFLINILFEYIGRDQKQKGLSQFILMPDLISPHQQSHEQLEKNILVLVDQKGQIQQVYYDKSKEEKLLFRMFTQVNKKIECNSPIQDITRQKIYNIVKRSIENKDYQKLPGFDSLHNFPNIDLDKFQKVPTK